MQVAGVGKQVEGKIFAQRIDQFPHRLIQGEDVAVSRGKFLDTAAVLRGLNRLFKKGSSADGAGFQRNVELPDGSANLFAGEGRFCTDMVHCLLVVEIEQHFADIK